MAAGDRVTRPGHVQYGELLLGSGTPYGWQSLTGWGDLPGVDSGTVARSGGHGAYPGALLAQTRTVTVEGLKVRAPRAAIGAAVGAFEAGTPLGDVELPLVVWLDERGPLLSWARVLRRSLPVGPGYRVGTILGGAVVWEASDPRRYSLDEQAASATLPAPEAGLEWPLAWPLEWGEPGSTGSMTAHNAGTAEAHPIIEFRGPVERPSLTNLSTGDVLEYDIPLAAGDVLTVDTGAGTVTLNGATSRLYTATARSVPELTFTFPPAATSALAFRAGPESSDPAASVTVRWRSAFW
ncbi:phage distal tail protein [Streptomyces chryseus]